MSFHNPLHNYSFKLGFSLKCSIVQIKVKNKMKEVMLQKNIFLGL